MRLFPALLLACALAAATPAATGSSGSSGSPSDRRSDDDRDPRGQQTSDGVRGEIALPLPAWARGTTTAIRKRWQVAPGVKAVVWAPPNVVSSWLTATAQTSPGAPPASLTIRAAS